MDLDKIKALIDAMAKSDVTELVLSEDGWTLRLVRGPRPTGDERVPIGTQGHRPKQFVPIAETSTTHPATATPELKAPLSGVVYLAPAPDKPPFVTAGQAIKAGTPICVIEAMKVFNEIRAEADGTIEAILVTSEQEVDAGQPLLRMARNPA